MQNNKKRKSRKIPTKEDFENFTQKIKVLVKELHPLAKQTAELEKMAMELKTLLQNAEETLLHVHLSIKQHEYLKPWLPHEISNSKCENL